MFSNKLVVALLGMVAVAVALPLVVVADVDASPLVDVDAVVAVGKRTLAEVDAAVDADLAPLFVDVGADVSLLKRTVVVADVDANVDLRPLVDADVDVVIKRTLADIDADVAVYLDPLLVDVDADVSLLKRTENLVDVVADADVLGLVDAGVVVVVS